MIAVREKWPNYQSFVDDPVIRFNEGEVETEQDEVGEGPEPEKGTGTEWHGH